MKPEAETGVMHLQAKESQGLPADPRKQKRQEAESTLELLDGGQPSDADSSFLPPEL